MQFESDETNIKTNTLNIN